MTDVPAERRALTLPIAMSAGRYLRAGLRRPRREIGAYPCGARALGGGICPYADFCCSKEMAPPGAAASWRRP